MSDSLYETLNLNSNATLKDIHTSFRKQALKWHPERNSSSSGDQASVNVASQKFAEVCESYEVLSDARLRAIYDRFGLEGLKNGVPGLQSPILPFKPQDPYVIFKKFFGTENPFESFFHDYGLSFTDTRDQLSVSHQFNQDFGPRIANLNRKQPEVVQTIYVSLADLYLGRDMRVNVHTYDNQSQEEKKSTLSFKIEPGLKTGSKIRFEKKIQKSANHEAVDIVFVIEEKSDERYSRNGSTLIYKADITLLDALTGGFVEVPTLDERQLRIPLNEIISSETIKVVKNEGMPIRGTNQKGELHLTFNIKFPTVLSPQQKSDLKTILENSL